MLEQDYLLDFQKYQNYFYHFDPFLHMETNCFYYLKWDYLLLLNVIHSHLWQ